MRISPWMLVVGVLAYIGITALCSIVSYTAVRDFVVRTEGSGVELPSFSQFLAAQPTPTRTPPPPTATNTPPPGVTFTPEPTVETATSDEPDPLADIPEINDPRRITILLMGIDQRSAVEESGPFRTDTMMLAQVDPVNKRVGVLSIPRDLWVTIPGFEPHRVNTANYLGDQNALPGGGPQLAMETVRANLGVRVENYVLINFNVFTTVVETLAPDGIEICIDQTIHDEKYPDAGYGTITVHFDPGCQNLNAEQLLQYARTRATQGGDFDRARRQQQVLKALQAKFLSVGGVANFVRQIPALYNQLSENYSTNLSLEEILSLARLMSEISAGDIRFGSINEAHVNFESVIVDGVQQDILRPIQSAINRVVQDTFNPPEDLTIADLRQRAESEEARIVVYNNTTISGLAGNTRDWLTSQGVTVSGVGNIEPPENASAIIIRDYTGKLWTARYLAALMDLPSDAIHPGRDGLTSADVMVVVGSDVQQFLGSGE